MDYTESLKKEHETNIENLVYKTGDTRKNKIFWDTVIWERYHNNEQIKQKKEHIKLKYTNAS